MKEASPINVKDANKLHVWHARFFSIGGVWPLEPSCLIFYMNCVYYIVHWILAMCDLANVFGNLSLTIANLLETGPDLIVGATMLVMRKSNLLEKLVKEVLREANEKTYRDKTEMELYMAYNTIGQIFFKIISVFSFGTCFLYHFQPLNDMLKAALQNETIMFVLPYRVRLFFDITDTPTYILLYLSQTPMFYYHYFHPMSICFLCTLIFHVAGEMAILAHRIRKIMPPDSSDINHSQIDFRDIVIKHYSIIWTATSIDDIFNGLLLQELVISTVLLGLTSYSLLSTTIQESTYEYFFVVNYIGALLTLIFIYCLTGEYLLYESANIQNAYYEFKWYDMPSKHRRDLLICMERAQNPLVLTAGRFYVFSMSRFSGVLKSAMAYISMLRAIT